ncbi:BQ5605_C023g09655 [Microbotryum silenes-dioicae]|uniref:BQ5605_C023g09655 protein n=1 Tax=Microbotryum silenes-dioicae TaxID=796604 RepID=A0A2X0N7D6_9BASI|nr:BQ5605_C023g09655 [Microbotryum silenes-dioicae]
MAFNISPLFSRHDRSSNALRALSLSQSPLSRVDGSSDLSALASITGPTEVRLRDELVDRAYLEIHVRPSNALPGPASKSHEAILRSLLSPLIQLHQYPRSLIQLTLQTLSTPSTSFQTTIDPSAPSPSSSSSATLVGASELSALINASTCALLDAGINLKGMLFSIAVAFLPLGNHSTETPTQSSKEMRLDPTPMEESIASSAHVFAFSFGVGVGEDLGECTGIESKGNFDEDQLFEAQEVAQKACQAVLAFVRKSIESKYAESRVAATQPNKKNKIKDRSEAEPKEKPGPELDGMDTE